MSKPSNAARQCALNDVGVSLGAVQAARERIQQFLYLSPCRYSAELSKATGNPVYLKLDNQQRTGAFKERGALNKILMLSPEEKQRGVIAATREYGAEVILHGANYDEAYAHAMECHEVEGTTFLHPFDDPQVIAGQGSIGLEILEQTPDIEAVVVPIGGGGLISGVACAIKELKPSVKVIGVQTERLPSMLRATEAGHPVTIPAQATVADGIAVRRAGDVTLPLVQRYVDEIVTVDEEEIANAILVLLEKEKTLAEGAGAVAVAALLQRKVDLEGLRTAALVCGGNIDVSLLAKIIERGLAKDGRRMRLRIHLVDRPGTLHEVTKIIADLRANIVETQYDRTYYGVNLGDTAIDISLETRGPEHIRQIESQLSAAGYRHERIE